MNRTEKRAICLEFRSGVRIKTLARRLKVDRLVIEEIIRKWLPRIRRT